MKKTGSFYKSKDDGLTNNHTRIVLCTKDSETDLFSGIVVVQNELQSGYQVVGYTTDSWVSDSFFECDIDGSDINDIAAIEPTSQFVKYPEIGGTYVHYKGGKYIVLTLAKHSETDEDMVVYQSLVFGSYHVRPLSMWFERVNSAIKGIEVARFTLEEEIEGKANTLNQLLGTK